MTKTSPSYCNVMPPTKGWDLRVYRIEQELEKTTVKLDIDETKLDESLMVVKQYITEGWPIAKNIEGAAMIYNSYRDELR
jgi:hypothetical protein